MRTASVTVKNSLSRVVTIPNLPQKWLSEREGLFIKELITLPMLEVIIPAYLPTKYHHRMFLRAIASLERQTLKDFSVRIVLNGCYTDYKKIIDSVKTDLNIIWEQIEGKASGAIARNYGIKKSKAKYIAQLDADDLYHPGKLEKQIEFFKTNSTYSFVGTRGRVYRETDPYFFQSSIRQKLKLSVRDPLSFISSILEPSAQKIHKIPSEKKLRPIVFPFKEYQYQYHDSIASTLKKENRICHGSVMFKRADFLVLGGYNEALKPGVFWPQYGKKMWEDWDLWNRAIQAGFKFYNLPIRLYYWSEGTSVER